MKTLDGIVLVTAGMGLVARRGPVGRLLCGRAGADRKPPGLRGLAHECGTHAGHQRRRARRHQWWRGTEMWGAMVNQDGVVCRYGLLWNRSRRRASSPGSRTIALAKANTSASFSTDEGAVASWQPLSRRAARRPDLRAGERQPGGPCRWLRRGRDAVWHGERSAIGKKIGGTIIFGGGLPLYDSTGKLVGGMGVSGDSSCADHIIAGRCARRSGSTRRRAATT